MELVLKDIDELEREGARLAKTLTPKDAGATVITLSGELGAGKTAFTKALAKALGVEEVITSPTFVIEKIYALSPLGGETPKFGRLVHIDAYRLEKGADLSALGFDELMKDAGNLVVIEWPEMVQNGLPKSDFGISIEALSDGARRIL